MDDMKLATYHHCNNGCLTTSDAYAFFFVILLSRYNIVKNTIRINMYYFIIVYLHKLTQTPSKSLY